MSLGSGPGSPAKDKPLPLTPQGQDRGPANKSAVTDRCVPGREAVGSCKIRELSGTSERTRRLADGGCLHMEARRADAYFTERLAGLGLAQPHVTALRRPSWRPLAPFRIRAQGPGNVLIPPLGVEG